MGLMIVCIQWIHMCHSSTVICHTRNLCKGSPYVMLTLLFIELFVSEYFTIPYLHWQKCLWMVWVSKAHETSIMWDKTLRWNPDTTLCVHKITKAKHVAVTLNVMSQKKQFGVPAVLILVCSSLCPIRRAGRLAEGCISKSYVIHLQVSAGICRYMSSLLSPASRQSETRCGSGRRSRPGGLFLHNIFFLLFLFLFLIYVNPLP